MTDLERYLALGRLAGCPADQIENFAAQGVVLQSRQLQASAAARLCDHSEGPVEVGYGGARGGGKSHWLLSQVGLDDCQRRPELKCLLLRKVGKANLESFDDLRRRVLRGTAHDFSLSRATLTFENGSRIVAGHFQHESDIDAYLGLEYDVIAIEEATTLSHRKFIDISTCLRTSKPDWRPRMYSTANPGGVGHAWYKARFILPFQNGTQSFTRFVPARVSDNPFANPEYRLVLDRLTGWQRRAWLDGDWDIAAGQFFTTFRRDVHVVSDFDDTRAREWFCAMDYGFAHYTVVLLGCTDGDGNTFVVDEHAERLWLPQRHAQAIRALLVRHRLHVKPGIRAGRSSQGKEQNTRRLELSDLKRFVAGADVFSRQSDGTTVAAQYAKMGITLRPANTDRINGWAEILSKFGDPQCGLQSPATPGDQANIRPTLFIHQRCVRLIETLPALQHDPLKPEDVLKVDVDDDGLGGDDAADALRYLLATKLPEVYVRKLRGL